MEGAATVRGATLCLSFLSIHLTHQKNNPRSGKLRPRLRKESFPVYRYQQMMKKLKVCKTLTGRKKTSSPKLTAKQMELARVESEIEKLLDTLTGAAPVLISCVNDKIEELDSRRQPLVQCCSRFFPRRISLLVCPILA